MANPIDLGFARSAHRMVKQADEALNLMVRSEQRELSIVDGSTDLRSGHGIQGFNRECLQEYANARGIDFDPHHPTWPYRVLSTRATPLSVNPTGANGGYLVESENQELVDIFRPYSPLLKSGVTVIGNLQANAVFPRVVTDVAGQWLSPETETITDMPPAFGSVATSPHTFGITVRWSRQLQLQARNLENYIRGICAKAAVEAVDLAALTGAGSAGAPFGLLNQGIGAQSGAALSHAGTWATRDTLADANVDDDAVSWLASPDVRTLLAVREEATGTRFVWDQDQITSRAARVSTIVPAGTLIAGDWSQLVYCFYGPGFEIDVTPFASALDFQTGLIALRLMVSVDVVLLHPAAFVAITGVS